MSSDVTVVAESAELPPNLQVPTSILVGTIRYRITCDEEEWLRIEHRSKTSGYYGHTTNLDATIWLNPASSPDVLRLTLWHEALHAVMESAAGCPEWTELGEDRATREETVIRRIESPTLALLRDNPELVAYLNAPSGQT